MSKDYKINLSDIYILGLKIKGKQNNSYVGNTAVGKWIICSDGYYPYCSNCGYEPTDSKIHNYCGNCGSLMEME